MHAVTVSSTMFVTAVVVFVTVNYCVETQNGRRYSFIASISKKELRGDLLSRPSRKWYPGAIYHVMSRGNRKMTLYKDRDDFLTFLEIVKKASRIFHFKIHALCLMTNHFHMAIETGDRELWKIMQWILHRYAVRFNKKYHYTGHLFEDRYTSCLIEDDSYFLEVTRYIHLNPVRAHMVSDALEYEYSSYQEFVKKMGANINEFRSSARQLISGLVDTSRTLSYFKGNPREKYKEFVEDRILKDMKEDSTWLPRN